MKNISEYSLIPDLNENDKRLPTFRKQIIKRGFDDTELWSLDVTIAKFILPRLKRFRKITIGSPIGYDGKTDNHKKWKKMLKKMIFSFDKIANENYEPHSKKTRKKINKGLKLFYKYYHSLWD